jgi:FAD binding domain/Berberine and berberine like
MDEGRIDRGEFLRRSAGVAGVAGLVGAGWPLGRSLGGQLAQRRRPPLGQLARVAQGPLLTPGGAAYSAARQVVNARYSGARPLAVLRARSVSDVRKAVAWSARYGVRITARSGGHSYAGYSTLDGGLVVDLSSLDQIAIAADRRTVQVGAGARLIDLYTTLAARGLTVPAGSCPTVGVGGLSLGGGVGLASRALGTTCDNLVSVTVVTADGRALVCDERRNADLFWACRGGGGGNFGIATSFTFQTHRVNGGSYFFASFPWSHADAVVGAWQRWAPHAPDELFSICSLSTGTTTTCNVFGQYMGSTAALRRTLSGLTRAVSPSSLSVGASSYINLIQRWAGCLGESPAECRRVPHQLFAAKSDYVRKPLSRAAIATLVSGIDRRQAQSALGTGFILLDSYGGVINRVAPDATAFVHRDALCSIQYGSYWTEASNAAAGVSWIRGVYRQMRPFVSGFAYQNYIDPDLTSWPHAYYGANLARLVDVKTTYDPDEVFRFRQGIRAA